MSPWPGGVLKGPMVQDDLSGDERNASLAHYIGTASKIFGWCHIPQLTLNKVAGVWGAVKVTDWSFKASVMISSGEDYIRSLCHADGWWISLVCVCVEKEEGRGEVIQRGQGWVHARVLVHRCMSVYTHVCLSVWIPQPLPVWKHLADTVQRPCKELLSNVHCPSVPVHYVRKHWGSFIKHVLGLYPGSHPVIISTSVITKKKRSLADIEYDATK